LMYKNKKFLAIIPARGGSKRLPHKNTLDICGKSLISWSIEAGIKSNYVDEIAVSSDSEKILSISKQFDITTIKRPDNLSRDDSSSYDVVEHVMSFYKDKIDKNFDYIVLLQPTSPLRTSKHIDEAIELLDEKQADNIVSVTKVEHSPLWCNTLTDTLSMENFISKDLLNIRSQDLREYYRLNGAIYIVDVKKLLKEKSFLLQRKVFAYIMAQEYSIDIDTKFDFSFAETSMKLLEGID